VIGLPRKVKGALEKAKDSALLAVEVYNKPAVKFGDFVGRFPRIQFARARPDSNPSFPERRRKSFR
jgi:hypothetical protein